MRYKISEIEDQIIATLQADTTNFSEVRVLPFAGQVNPQMFFNPEYMEGAVQLLPFTLVSYQGRTNVKDKRSSDGKTRLHKLRFRLYNGALSGRETKEAVRSCYNMMAACFDDLQSKVPVTSPQQLACYTALSGTALTSTGSTILGPLTSVEGDDEVLVVNLPEIVVYASDYTVELVA